MSPLTGLYRLSTLVPFSPGLRPNNYTHLGRVAAGTRPGDWTFARTPSGAQSPQSGRRCKAPGGAKRNPGIQRIALGQPRKGRRSSHNKGPSPVSRALKLVMDRVPRVPLRSTRGFTPSPAPRAVHAFGVPGAHGCALLQHLTALPFLFPVWVSKQPRADRKPEKFLPAETSPLPGHHRVPVWDNHA